MLYRVVKPLAVGPNLTKRIEPGSTVSDDRWTLRIIEKLEWAGAISPISPPPLDALPGWKLRAKRFDEAGYNALSLLETTDEEVAEATGYQPRSIAKWKRELEKFMMLGKEKVTEGCKNC